MQGTFGHISSKMKSHLNDKKVPKLMLCLMSHILVFVDVHRNSNKLLHPPIPMHFNIKNITIFQPCKGILGLFQTLINNDAHTILQHEQVKIQFKKM
jgi:hypothetical protein